MKLPLILSRHMGKIPAMTGPSRSTRRTWIRTWKRVEPGIWRLFCPQRQREQRISAAGEESITIWEIIPMPRRSWQMLPIREVQRHFWFLEWSMALSQITQMPGQCTSSTSIRSWMIRPGIRHRLPHRDTMDWQCAIWQKEAMILPWKISAAELPLLPMMKCRACYLMKL